MSLRIGLFAYNFPHKKTTDVIARLLAEGYRIELILAADPVTLNIPPASVRTKLRHLQGPHPADVAKNLGIPYRVTPHNSPEAVEAIQAARLDVGVVGGARILKKPVIEAFSRGIVNFHPGLIPEARGLDAMLWSIHRDVPLGVTAHLIDERVDAGEIILKQPIRIYPDDTVYDLSERLYEIQLEMLRPSLERLARGEALEAVDAATPYNRKMPAELEAEAMARIPDYIRARCAAPV